MSDLAALADLAPIPWPSPVPVKVSSIIRGGCVLLGFAIKETTGSTTAELDMYDGIDTSSGTFLPIALTPGQSTSETWFPQGLRFRIGYFPSITGSIAGCVYLAFNP